MKRIIAAACVLPMALAAMAAAEITVGSYNIRVETPNDHGPNNWDARKEYVAQTVLDAGMDVVGFNEVKSERQQTELRELLPQFDMVGWDGHSNAEIKQETAVDLVAFRRDKFECMDHGVFFLSRTPDVWEQSWDNSSIYNVRHTSWAKLRVQDTDEIFFVFCTHLDHQGNIARMLQSHLNLAMMRRIAGHYPKVMVGDQNSTSSRVNMVNIYNAHFDDCYTAGGGTAKYGEDVPTSGQWNEGWENNPSGKRIDYVWADGFDVLDYNHHTDIYDLGARPSDHIAISARLRLQDPQIGARYHYVKAGSAGTGTKSSPYGTLKEAIDAARRGDTIFVAAGEYPVTKSVALNKTVKLFGGYDEDFSEIVGLSKVIAQGDIRCMSQGKGATDVELRYFGLYNGHITASSSDGAGLMAHGSRAILRYCEIADCYAARDGGGIDATGQLILDHVRFRNNTAGRNGGAVCCDNPNKRYWFNMPVTNCYFEGNKAVDGSALYLPRFVYGYVAGCTFSGNEATEGTTAYLHAVGSSETSLLGSNLSVFNNTFTGNKASGEAGSAAFVAELESGSNVSVVCNTILANSGTAYAVRVLAGKPYVAGNIIALNEGGDLGLNVASVSASHNVYTCRESITNTPNSQDFMAEDYASALEMLRGVVDGEVTDGRFLPTLSRETPDRPEAASELAPGVMVAPTLHDYVGNCLPDGPDLSVPVVKILKPEIGGSTLCKLPVSRLRELTVHADFNFDCMYDAILAVDATGYERPADGKSTIGAVEYRGGSGIISVPVAGEEDYFSGTGATVEFFNLQGIRVYNPKEGEILIRKQGAKVEKVVL